MIGCEPDHSWTRLLNDVIVRCRSRRGNAMKSPVVHVAALATAFLLGTHAAPAENRVALVIGQSAYRAVPPLANPRNDAKMMIELLTAAGFEVTAAPDVSQSEMRKAIGDFAEKLSSKGPDTVALVYYA